MGRATSRCPGRELAGIHYAMDFLPQQNKRNAGDDEPKAAPGGTITAKGKHVIVIGGGDTGSDCIGTSTRQGAASITQLEILPKPPEHENKALTWPDWPLKLRTSSSQEEGCERDWAVLTKRAVGANGKVDGARMRAGRVGAGKTAAGSMQEMPGSEFELKADLVLLAMGFVGPRRPGMIEQAGVGARPARQRPGQHGRLQDLGGEAVLRRRHAARPVAGRLGDPRRPAMRPRDRRIPDGEDDPAALEVECARRSIMSTHLGGSVRPALP